MTKVTNTLRLGLLAGLGGCLLLTPAFGQVGLMPVPTLQNVQVQAETSIDPETQQYTFSYAINNPLTNTGRIFDIKVDITTQIPSASGAAAFDSSGLTIPSGTSRRTFDQARARLPLALPAGTRLIPFGLRVPSGWDGALSVDGFASFSSDEPANIIPGHTQGGFLLISRGIPTIRNMQVEPFWALIVDAPETVSDEVSVAAADIQRSIIFHTFTLGPSAHTPGTFAHWDQVRDDLNQAIQQLGWVADQTLATALVSQLASARKALDAVDGTLAKARLQTLIQTITQSTPAQRRREVADLILLNAQRLKEATPDTVFPIEPKLKVAPQSSTLPLGTRYTLTATVTNLGDPANPPQDRLYLGIVLQPGHLPASL